MLHTCNSRQISTKLPKFKVIPICLFLHVLKIIIIIIIFSFIRSMLYCVPCLNINIIQGRMNHEISCDGNRVIDKDNSNSNLNEG